MQQWEYTTIDLGGASDKVDDVGVLTRAGNEGWELVAITVNNAAYLKSAGGQREEHSTAEVNIRLRDLNGTRVGYVSGRSVAFESACRAYGVSFDARR